MLEIGVVLEGMGGTSAFDITIEGFETSNIHDAVFDYVIDYLYNSAPRRKIHEMLIPTDHADLSILTNYGEVVDVYVVDVQPIIDEYDEGDIS